MGNYLTAFLIGGLICVIGQIILDNTKYTPAHLLVGLVVTASILTGLGYYEKLIKFAGAGVTVPVANFGHILTKGVLEAMENDGFLALFKGVLAKASAGVSGSVIIAFTIALIFNTKK